MAWYRCFACGENFPLVHEGDLGLFGFYTTRYIEAANAEDAEDKAARAIFADPDLTTPMGAPGADRARLYFEEVVEVDAREQDRGFSFFPMEEPS